MDTHLSACPWTLQLQHAEAVKFALLCHVPCHIPKNLHMPKAEEEAFLMSFRDECLLQKLLDLSTCSLQIGVSNDWGSQQFPTHSTLGSTGISNGLELENVGGKRCGTQSLKTHGAHQFSSQPSLDDR